MKIFIQLLLFLSICQNFFSQEIEGKKISFCAVFDQEKLDFGKQYITKNKDTVSISNFKFYVSNLKFVYEDDTFFEEPKSVYLIDFEEQNLKTFIIKSNVSKKIKKMIFEVGIDSLTNVSENYDGDLDPRFGMYWAWNTGYINMKLEGKSKSCKTRKNEFMFHIGGYAKNQYAIKKIELNIQNDNLSVEVDLKKWLDQIDLKTNNMLMSPGAKAIELAEKFKLMFQNKLIN